MAIHWDMGPTIRREAWEVTLEFWRHCAVLSIYSLIDNNGETLEGPVWRQSNQNGIQGAWDG